MYEVLEKESKAGTPVGQSNHILTIQKFITLLSDFHYEEYLKYLQETNSVLPIRLAETIRKKLPDFDSHSELCTKVYGSSNTSDKKKFNQLTVHTFKLSHYLANNYPDYLAHNIQRVEQLVNTGHAEDALKLTSYLLDIADRVEDFRTIIWCLQFLGADARLNRDLSKAVKLADKLLKVIEAEMICVRLQQMMNLSSKEEKTPFKTLALCREEVEPYFEHPSVAVQITALYAYNNWVYHYDPSHYQNQEDLRLLNLLVAKLNQYPHVVFPFMTNMYGNTIYIKLNSTANAMQLTERKRLYEELEEYYQHVQFTSVYVKEGHLYLIAIECSRIVSTYYQYLHRHDYNNFLPARDRQYILKKIATCEHLLSLEINRKSNEVIVANLKMLYGALLVMLGGDANINRGITELEALLVLYQQMNLNASTDSIFMVLIIAYFALAKYDKCVTVYKRYIKVRKTKSIYEGNDEKIAAYYYLAQLLLTNRSQYKEKLKGVIYKGGKKSAAPTLLELTKQLNVSFE